MLKRNYINRDVYSPYFLRLRLGLKVRVKVKVRVRANVLGLRD